VEYVRMVDAAAVIVAERLQSKDARIVLHRFIGNCSPGGNGHRCRPTLALIATPCWINP